MSIQGLTSTSDSDSELVFISYSHRDKKWLDLLINTLRPYIEQTEFECWDDTRIRPGEAWEAELRGALTKAKVAILLISTHFLTSDYIRNEELPIILEAADKGDCKLLWVLLDHCGWDVLPIKQRQSLHNPTAPLISLTDPQLNQEVNNICRNIRAGITGSAARLSRAELPIPTKPAKSMESLLLLGYLYYEANSEEQILVRGDSRLPIIQAVKQDDQSLNATHSLINAQLLALLDELGIPVQVIFSRGVSVPEIRPIHKISRANRTVDLRPWIFFKLRLQGPVQGTSILWRQQGYQWKPKSVVASVWHGQFEYGFNDLIEAPLSGITEDPYKILIQDRVSFELGHRILDCVDMLIFRLGERRRIEFLLVRRKDDGSWEYPKGGLEYHESHVEGALREIDEEVGIDRSALQYCGDLGWQMPDVSYRHKFYDTLRVHGLTFFYTGARDGINTRKMFEHDQYRWLPLAQARAMVSALPYSDEFFDRWKAQHARILARAQITAKLN